MEQNLQLKLKHLFSNYKSVQFSLSTNAISSYYVLEIDLLYKNTFNNTLPTTEEIINNTKTFNYVLLDTLIQIVNILSPGTNLSQNLDVINKTLTIQGK